MPDLAIRHVSIVGQNVLLEAELQSELNVPGTARADHRICRCHVWCVENETKGSRIGRINQALGIRVRKVRVVEEVEKLRAQLDTHTLVQVGRLDNGEVQIVQPRAAEGIPADVSESAEVRRHQDCSILDIAAKRLELTKIGMVNTRLRTSLGSRKVEERNTCERGLDIRRIADDVPAVGKFSGSAAVASIDVPVDQIPG